jgi:hypothetical protein
MKALTELKLSKYDSPLYLISYVNDDTGEVGVDYTSNLAEFLELLDFHAKHSSDYKITKVERGD